MGQEKIGGRGWGWGVGGGGTLGLWVIVDWLPSIWRCQGSETQLWPGAVSSSLKLSLVQRCCFWALFYTLVHFLMTSSPWPWSYWCQWIWWKMCLVVRYFVHHAQSRFLFVILKRRPFKLCQHLFYVCSFLIIVSHKSCCPSLDFLNVLDNM